jgi:hypothetical protein
VRRLDERRPLQDPALLVRYSEWDAIARVWRKTKLEVFGPQIDAETTQIRRREPIAPSATAQLRSIRKIAISCGVARPQSKSRSGNAAVNFGKPSQESASFLRQSAAKKGKPFGDLG